MKKIIIIGFGFVVFLGIGILIGLNYNSLILDIQKSNNKKTISPNKNKIDNNLKIDNSNLILKKEDIIIKLLLDNNLSQLYYELKKEGDKNGYMFLGVLKYSIDKNNEKVFNKICPLYYTKEKCVSLRYYFFDLKNNKIFNKDIDTKIKDILIELKYGIFYNGILSKNIINNLNIDNSLKVKLIKSLSKLNNKGKYIKEGKCKLFSDTEQVFTSVKGGEYIKELCLFYKKINENK